MAIEYQVIRSRRRTLEIQIKPGGKVIVRAPLQATDTEIMRFVNSRSVWILEHVEKMKADAVAAEERLSIEDIRKLAEEAVRDLPARVQRFAPIVGVSYGRITIRNQKSKWGSCSGKGNLNFNCLLMLAPEDVRDYVVVHELCHLKELNHSKRFWALVERVLPDYRRREAWLKTEGVKIMRRMTG